MKRFILPAFAIIVSAALSAQTFRNPVIPGYHPDPSVCLVGDTFYLVNSSFEYFPGVPIYESRDLVHWRQIGNVLDRRSQLNLDGADSWGGIYAPTIRYNGGIYYMVTTNVSHGGNFLVTAKSPEGPWSEPVRIKQGGIDPSLYFEDGHCYFCSNPNGGIYVCEINPRTGEQISESHLAWRGTGGRYVEGPHIYKKDGYYYLLTSEGGTELAHGLTIARSRNIFGPYESNPANPIMTNCRAKGQTKQIQGTGHGDFIQAADGSWWIVFLAYRNMGGSYHHIGRETCLAPVEWKEGEWPVIYGGEAIDTEMKASLLPSHPYKADSDKLEEDNPAWVHIQNPDSSKYEWLKDSRNGGGIRLHGSESSLTQNNRPTYIGRRQEAERMSAEVKVTLHGSKDFEAGLSVYQIFDGHYDFYAAEGDGGRTDIVLRYEIKGLPQNVSKAEEIDGKDVFLRVRSGNNEYVFEYSADGKEYAEAGRLDSTLLSTEAVGGFTGVTIGMYAHGEGYADFTQWNYEGNDPVN